MRSVLLALVISLPIAPSLARAEAAPPDPAPVAAPAEPVSPPVDLAPADPVPVAPAPPADQTAAPAAFDTGAAVAKIEHGGPAPVSSRRRAIALGAVTGAYAAFSTWAVFAWYVDHPPNQGFVFGGDGLFERSAYAGGADKMGHAWATMVLGRLTSQGLKLGGWSPRTSALIGAGLSSTLFTLVEVADAYYYEFSVGDLAADLLGAAVGAAFEMWPRADELFDFRVEYYPSPEYRSILRGDPGRDDELDLKKANFAEDYSGQTYLGALHLGAFPAIAEGKYTWPLAYVDAVVGFGSRKYRPAPLAEEMATPTQTLSLGVSLNLQGVFDRLLAGGGTGKGVARTITHAVFEVLNAPYTSLRPLSVSRSCVAPACVPD
jgi:hypothetical protein